MFECDSRGPHRIDPATRPRPSTLVGERVVLRPLEEADLAPLLAILAKPGAREFWWADSIEELREDVCGDEDSFSLAIEHDAALIGVIMYSEELWRDYFSASIDIAMDPEVRGRGLGPESIRLLARWLFDVGGHHRITLDPAAINTPAIRAYEKVGFKTVGLMRQYERGPDGLWRDSLLMDLLAGELVG